MKSTIHFSCDHYGQSIEAPKEYQGIVLDCPTCQQKTLCHQPKPVLKRAVVFLLLILPVLLVGSVFFPDHLSALIFVGFVVGLYFLPSFIAYPRKHLNCGAVFVANLLLGWTFLGWVICLIWALMRTQTKK